MPRWMPLSPQPRLLGAQLGVAHALDQDVDAALVRQVLELDAAGADNRIAVIGVDVAAAHLDRIDAERHGGPVDQVLADRVADGMADRAVLRGGRLVQIDDGGARPVVLVPVGPARDVEDLRALEHAGARILRVGAGARQHVDVEAHDLARLAHGDARLHEVLARVDVGHEQLQPVGDELDRPAQLDCRRSCRQLVAVAVDLEPERAADVRGHDLHACGQARPACCANTTLDHVRALAAGVMVSLPVPPCRGRQHGARLEAHRRVPAELEGVRDDQIGLGERRLSIAVVDRLAKGQIVAERGVDDGRTGIERASSFPRRPAAPATRCARAPRRPRPRLACAPRPCTAGSPTQHARSTAIGYCGADFMPGKQVSVPTHGPVHELGQLRSRHDQGDARLAARCIRVDRHDPGVGEGAAHERGVQHARQGEVVGVAAAPGHGAPGAGARQGAADVAVGPVKALVSGLSFTGTAPIASAGVCRASSRRRR